jgi:tRNA (guanine-N7-)-methyltransferase
LSVSDPQQLLNQCQVRSFVRRDGRITKAQQRAIDTLWGRYGIDPEAGQLLDFESIHVRKAPVWLEIGFGNGEALITMARDLPEVNFLGVDVYRPGIGHLLRLTAANELHNIRVFHGDAMQLLKKHIRPQSVDRVLLFFPDPWPKKRHHKRRLVRTDFARLIGAVLRSGGLFHMATDWEDYAQHALEVMIHDSDFVNIAGGNGFAKRPDYRPKTKFEQRGKRLGHGVWDLLFRRR